jgi:hypothetical protein
MGILGIVSVFQRAKTNRLLTEQTDIMTTGKTIAQLNAEKWLASPQGKRVQARSDGIALSAASRHPSPSDPFWDTAKGQRIAAHVAEIEERQRRPGS